jgi:hypothetical protein
MNGRAFQRTYRDAHTKSARCLARNIERIGKATVKLFAVLEIGNS